MKYINIHKSRLTHAMIAKWLGYKTTKSFQNSTKHKKIMKGIDEIINYCLTNSSKKKS